MLEPLRGSEARKAAEECVKRFGAHKALTRGFYDRYMPESVLAASKSISSQDLNKNMAEAMIKEHQNLFSEDLVMVPSMHKKTGW